MKKNIIYVFPEFPLPVNSGGRLAVIENLKKINKDFDIIAIVLLWNTIDEKLYDEFLPLVKEVHYVKRKYNNSIWQKMFVFFRLLLTSASKVQLYFGILDDLILNLSKSHKTEKILIDHLNGGMLLSIDALRCTNVTYIAHNNEFKLSQQHANFKSIDGIVNFIEQKKIKQQEGFLLRNSCNVIFFTDRDRDELCTQYCIDKERYNFLVIPPLISPMEYSLISRDELIVKLKIPAKFQSRKIIYLPTNARWEPNIISLRWFFSQVFPLLKKDNVLLLITGQDSIDHFLKKIDNEFDEVIYLGLIEHSLLPQLYSNADITLNPTIVGSGFQMKLVEALAYGANVVTSKFSNHLCNSLCEFDHTSVSDTINTLSNVFEYNTIKSPISYSVLYEKNRNILIGVLNDSQ